MRKKCKYKFNFLEKIKIYIRYYYTKMPSNKKAAQELFLGYFDQGIEIGTKAGTLDVFDKNGNPTNALLMKALDGTYTFVMYSNPRNPYLGTFRRNSAVNPSDPTSKAEFAIESEASGDSGLAISKIEIRGIDPKDRPPGVTDDFVQLIAYGGGLK